MIAELISKEKLDEVFELSRKFANVEKAFKKVFNMFEKSPVKWDLKEIVASSEVWNSGSFDGNSGRINIELHFCDTETKQNLIMYTMNMIYYDGVMKLQGSNAGKWKYQPPELINSTMFYYTSEKGVKEVLLNGFPK